MQLAHTREMQIKNSLLNRTSVQMIPHQKPATTADRNSTAGRNLSERKCPAFNHTCGKCGILHHYESVCRSPQQNSTQNYSRPTTHDAVFHDYTAGESKFQADTTDDSSFFNASMFDDLTATKSLIWQSTTSTNAITLDHHIYNSLQDTWMKQKSDP